MSTDLLGSSDPFVVIQVPGSEEMSTQVRKNQLNPQWFETFRIPIIDPLLDILKIKVMDLDKVERKKNIKK
jgi:Ca2+-dependent lipid-binding protein